MPGAALFRSDRNARRSSSSSTYWTTLVSRASFLALATSSASLVDTVGSASGAAVLLSPNKLSCAAPSLHGHCPASLVLRATPPPIEAWRLLGLTALLPLLTIL